MPLRCPALSGSARGLVPPKARCLCFSAYSRFWVSNRDLLAACGGRARSGAASRGRCGRFLCGITSARGRQVFPAEPSQSSTSGKSSVFGGSIFRSTSIVAGGEACLARWCCGHRKSSPVWLQGPSLFKRASGGRRSWTAKGGECCCTFPFMILLA